jgi:hypothetical protein
MKTLALALFLAVSGDLPPETVKAHEDVYEFSAIIFEGREPVEWGQKLFRAEKPCRDLEESVKKVAAANNMGVVTACRKVTPPSPPLKRQRDS